MVLDRRFVWFDAMKRIVGKPWVATKHEKVGRITSRRMGSRVIGMDKSGT
jgi:hypothetical protein